MSSHLNLVAISRLYFCIISWTNSLSAGERKVSLGSVRLKMRSKGRGGWRGGRGEHTIDPSIAILVSLPDHLIHLIISQLLSDARHDVTQFGGRNEAVVVAVENFEGLTNLLFAVGILHLARHHGKELWGAGVNAFLRGGCRLARLQSRLNFLGSSGKTRTREVNCAIVIGIDLVDHVLELRLAGILAQRAHNGAELLRGNLSCRVGANLS